MNSAEYNPEELLNIKQAAKFLNTSVISIRRWSDAGKLPCLRIGLRRERRFRLADLAFYLEQNKTPVSVPKTNHTAHRITHIKLEGITIDYGTHLCAFYETDQGRLKLALPFLLSGLQAGDRCFLVASSEAQTHILKELRDVRLSIDEDIKKDHLIVMDGLSSATAMYAFFEKAFLEANKYGIHGLRVLGDMAWALHKNITFEELNDFETRYNNGLGKRFPVVSLCQYDARMFSGIAILGALKCHEDALHYPLTHFLGT
jgi:transcriptional repressor of dcmA and dcmR